MGRLAKKLVQDAVRLPESDRIRLVEEVLASLDESDERAVDAAWAAEVERRSRQIRRGLVRPIPWETVKSRARSLARKRVRARS